VSTQKSDSGVSPGVGSQPNAAKSQKLNDLLLWEQEWYQAFRQLRDGLPERSYRAPVFEREEPSNPNEPEKFAIRWEVVRMKGWPPEPGLWDALVRARTPGAVREVCRRWEKWLHPGSGLQPYPQRLAEHATEFLKIMKDKRFPRSLRPSSDKKRLDYFARGMAGIDTGVSPITAIDRLRKMKHRRECDCWRCNWKRMEEFVRFISRVSLEEEK